MEIVTPLSGATDIRKVATVRHHFALALDDFAPAAEYLKQALRLIEDLHQSQPTVQHAFAFAGILATASSNE